MQVTTRMLQTTRGGYFAKRFSNHFVPASRRVGPDQSWLLNNSIDGVPCHINSVLLKDILRKEWNFKGFVVSDYSGVKGIFSAHKLAESYAEAQAQSLEAGLDVELSRGYGDLLSLVLSKRISEKQIDESLRSVLTCKFELGLFDDPLVDAAKADQIVRKPGTQKTGTGCCKKSDDVAEKTRMDYYPCRIKRSKNGLACLVQPPTY